MWFHRRPTEFFRSRPSEKSKRKMQREQPLGNFKGGIRRQERKKEKLQDPTKQSKSTKSKRTEGRASKSTDETPSVTRQTKQESETKSVRAAKGSQKKGEEQKVPVQAVRGRRKPPGAAQAAAPAPKNQSNVEPVEVQSASAAGPSLTQPEESCRGATWCWRGGTERRSEEIEEDSEQEVKVTNARGSCDWSFI